MFITQGHGVTLIYVFDRLKQVPPNTPTSMYIPFYEVCCQRELLRL